MLFKPQKPNPLELAGPGCLSIRVIQTKDLVDFSDAYCRVSCDFSRQVFSTRTCKRKAGQPDWNEDFHFYVGNPLPSHSVTVQVVDKELFQSEVIGEVTFDLTELLQKQGNTLESWYTIVDPNKYKSKSSHKPLGSIQLRLTFPKDSDLRGVIKHEDPKKYYSVEKTLGEGSFGTVRFCTNKKTKKTFAMKIINKQKLDVKQLELLQREIIIMSKLSHPSIVQLEEAFDSEKTTTIVLELAAGGSVLNKLITVGPYSEKDACHVMRQLIEACQYMSSCGIAHRDLKPDNLLIGEGGAIKVSDFGLSKDFTFSILTSAVGTANYVAPEVLLGGQYNSACDVWSCGVICYTLLSSQMPFFGSDNARVFEKILAVDYSFPDAYFEKISDVALDFIEKIFVANPLQRATYPELLKHPWMSMFPLENYPPVPETPKETQTNGDSRNGDHQNGSKTPSGDRAGADKSPEKGEKEGREGKKDKELLKERRKSSHKKTKRSASRDTLSLSRKAESKSSTHRDKKKASDPL